MNRKSFMDKIPILILIILIGAYYFMNIDENKTLVQSGGNIFGGGNSPKYPPGTPFLYQMRYVVYFLFVFLIVYNIYYSYQSYKVSTLSLNETGSAFLTSFAKANKAIIVDKLYKGTDPVKQQYDNFISACNVDYKPFVDSFCKMFAPCSCCGIGDYAPSGPKANMCKGVDVLASSN